MNKLICDKVDEHYEQLAGLALKIWKNPEIGWHETKAAEWTAQALRDNGFETEVGAYGMPTAIRAVWGKGRPVAGFCAEYDCLPGLSQDHCTYQKPITEGGPGHGCGHNLLGTGCLGACIGLKAALETSGREGTVIFYGCPAEEQVIGKGLMAKNGAFRECDFTLTWHPDLQSSDTTGNFTGLESMTVEFFGRASHAAAIPQDGRSALDALQIMNIGVEFLREHVTSDVRIHYMIMDGGLAPNIVPAHASAKYMVRALSRKSIVDAYSRVVKCAEGAAHMTDTDMKITRLGGVYPTLQNKVIGDAVQEARREIPLVEYTEEELRFADELNRQSPRYTEGTIPLNAFNQTLRHTDHYGSTDYGDVEHIVPGFQVRECALNSLAAGHDWMSTASSGSSYGIKGMIRAAKIMAVSAYKMMADPERLAMARREFDKSMNGRSYVCPVDDTVEWPYK